MSRIAVVNDDTTFLSLMGEVLQDGGHDVLVCKEGSSSYAVLKRELPDLVIVDIRMDTPDAGWMVCELLTLDPRTRHIPIIVCSANIHNLREKRHWLAEHGVGAIAKPFDLDDLDKAVNTALETGTPPILGMDEE